MILGLAAVITAFSAYRAALTDGDALQGYTESSQALNDANFFFQQTNQQYAFDQAVFLDFAGALQAGDEERADYIYTLMDPHLQEAVDWWVEQEDVASPFHEADGNPYAVPDADAGPELQETANARFAEGKEADEQGDQFELAGVFLTVTLFFAGIGPLFKGRRIRRLLLGMAVVTLVGGTAFLLAAL